MKDIEECARCGFDHEHESDEAQDAHHECRLCQREVREIGIGNGPDHFCQDHVEG